MESKIILEAFSKEVNNVRISLLCSIIGRYPLFLFIIYYFSIYSDNTV